MNTWLISKRADLLVLFAPVWVCWMVFFMLPDAMVQQEAPIWVWVVFVIGIDVSHVWSTLFRTYMDREEFRHHRRLLIFTPFLCFAGAFLVSSLSFEFFWRCLAYLAVYHFIKQQYGFMRIYKAKAKDFRPKLFKDNFIIYMSMLYPVLYWHLNLDRNFNWFIENDFLQMELSPQLLSTVNLAGTLAYFVLLAAWLGEELFIRKGKVAVPKVLWVLTTAGNWFIGIVYFNADLVFTVTNVIAHGIPYLALVIFYQTSKPRTGSKPKPLIGYSLTVIGVVLLLALSEEYLWDVWVYQENVAFFSKLFSYPEEAFSVGWQHLALAILSVPQMTHYVLDGYIWKNNARNPHLKEALLG